MAAFVRKRNGQRVVFDQSRIENAIKGAFREHLGVVSEALNEEIVLIANDVGTKINQERLFEEAVDVERIQDIVELILMRKGHYEVARCYIVYREAHARLRQLKKDQLKLGEACKGLNCSSELLFQEVVKQLYDGITAEEVDQIAILSAKGMIEKEPDYSRVAARLLMGKIKKVSFGEYIREAVIRELLDPRLLDFDLEELEWSLKMERNELFSYLGLQALYDRYLIHFDGTRVEDPQYFWMRVAMGLSLNEKERAVEFYNVMSTFDYLPGTPTLFNSGTLHPQLSSCYLSTVQDDLSDIFKVIGDNAKLSKWAGGLGNDWTPIRATNASIKGTNGKSQGLIPFLKIVNDTAVAVNQGGKRKGAVCCYLETWHLDINEFLDLKKNTGDERRRTHDMNTANWIPDLFMQRVALDQTWTLFSPDDVPDLHDLYGEAFEKRYVEYEQMAREGKIKLHQMVSALQLWRKMLSRLFETGHPWITFKDASNLRSMQPHTGVIHSSNLCTEILLNTSKEETAVCNLGSINLAFHIEEGKLNLKKLEQTINCACRMLDNVIDINFYPTNESKNSNARHRPVGMGIMGFQDALFLLRLPYDSEEAMEFADRSMEAISYFAIQASAKLAEERGSYSSFAGSRWSEGILPFDTLNNLKGRQIDRSTTLDWESLRAKVKRGMRNSYVMAIAPTATISLIAGVSQSIEPLYSYLFVKSNLSGETAEVYTPLVNELKEKGLWDEEMLDELKYHDGSIQTIERIPQSIKRLFKTSFEIEPKWLIIAGSRRQKWLDMGQSLNLYLSEPSGIKLDQMYRLAWEKGLKTTYYLRTKAATQVEKSTLDINKFAIQPKWMKNISASSSVAVPRSCGMEEGCEVCQ